MFHDSARTKLVAGVHILADAVKLTRGPNGRNLRTVWEVPTHPLREAHFATFPPALEEP
jgi:hypothetical protein